MLIKKLVLVVIFSGIVFGIRKILSLMRRFHAFIEILFFFFGIVLISCVK